MNPSELKYNVEAQGHDRYFFTRNTMRFFGDTMRNYGTRSASITVQGTKVEVWELWRKRPVKNGLKCSAYFRKDTFAQVFADKAN